jgi:hypothetical protein
MRGELRQGKSGSFRGIRFEDEFSSEARWRIGMGMDCATTDRYEPRPQGSRYLEAILSVLQIWSALAN